MSETSPHPWTGQVKAYFGERDVKAFTPPSGSIDISGLPTLELNQAVSPLTPSRALLAEVGVSAWPQDQGVKTISYLRQNLRDENAALWTEGPKPTSNYGLALVTAEAMYIAHIAEGISTEWLSDWATWTRGFAPRWSTGSCARSRTSS
jgi:hypothetical protein